MSQRQSEQSTTMQMADKATLDQKPLKNTLDWQEYTPNRIHEQPQTRHPPNQTRCIPHVESWGFQAFGGCPGDRGYIHLQFILGGSPNCIQDLHIITLLGPSIAVHTPRTSIYVMFTVPISSFKYRHQTISNVYMPCQPMWYSGALWIPLGPCTTGICYSGASSILPVGVVMCSWAVDHTFSNLSIVVQCWERLAQWATVLI